MPRGVYPRPTAIERFTANINKDGPTQPHMETCCWVWTGRCDRDGYGELACKGIPKRTHRYAWTLAHGPIPRLIGRDVACILHRCDNPPCVRPDHLFLGTMSDNAADRHRKGREAKGGRNGAYTQPGRLARGDRHNSRINPASVPWGERVSTAKLTAEDVLHIRTNACVTTTIAELAERFAVSASTIDRALHNRTWKRLGLGQP